MLRWIFGRSAAILWICRKSSGWYPKNVLVVGQTTIGYRTSLEEIFRNTSHDPLSSFGRNSAAQATNDLFSLFISLELRCNGADGSDGRVMSGSQARCLGKARLCKKWHFDRNNWRHLRSICRESTFLLKRATLPIVSSLISQECR